MELCLDPQPAQPGRFASLWKAVDDGSGEVIRFTSSVAASSASSKDMRPILVLERLEMDLLGCYQHRMRHGGRPIVEEGVNVGLVPLDR
jgi:hypothetical protein